MIESSIQITYVFVSFKMLILWPLVLKTAINYGHMYMYLYVHLFIIISNVNYLYTARPLNHLYVRVGKNPKFIAHFNYRQKKHHLLINGVMKSLTII